IVCEKTVVVAARRMKAMNSARMLVALLHCAELKIGAPTLNWIRAIEHQRSIDPNLFGFGVDAERISRPKHDVSILPDLKRSDFVVQAQRPRRINRQPANGLIFSDRYARGATCIHRFGNFLVESLRAQSAV